MDCVCTHQPTYYCHVLCLSIHVLRLSRPTYSRVRKHLGDGFLVNLAHPHETECLPVVIEFEGLSAVEFCRAFVRAYVALNGIVGIRIHCSQHVMSTCRHPFSLSHISIPIHCSHHHHTNTITAAVGFCITIPYSVSLIGHSAREFQSRFRDTVRELPRC